MGCGKVGEGLKWEVLEGRKSVLEWRSGSVSGGRWAERSGF